ncbi:probable low affinity copper uptake protein 2 isoform X1 [Tachysurus fulvidraco]|uniref:probable low affinity copper uptake protein 2 isoform X1 n=1 Tax=Tachysurus fulvidraco TaxID=1234273 RepID=UPI001FEFA63E|nr:probable low affinity copper uptake protein 2 isoform X1 [Tachysurus fulvidraco]
MQMHFEASSTVTLLFDFWSVHGPGGMVLSVLVVLLLTVLYEFLKVWKNVLVKRSEIHSFSPELEHPESSSSLANSPSQVSLAPTENTTAPVLGTSTANRCRIYNLAPPWRSDRTAHCSGGSGIHAYALCHVLQRLDIPRSDCGLFVRLLHRFPCLGLCNVTDQCNCNC